jgi:hypothetical protein
MELKLIDRAVLFTILPRELSFDSYKTVKALQKVLAITDEEKAACNWRTEGDMVRWDDDKDITKDIILTADALKLIKAQFNRLSAENKLSPEQAEVGMKFIELEATA